MALGVNERQRSGVPLQDPDGRLIVVGPNGVPIAGGAGGGGGDPLSDGDPAGTLPTKTLWVAGADGAVLRGMVVDATGRLRTVVEGSPDVTVSNFPGSQAVTGPLTDAQLRASNVPVSGPLTDTQLRAAPVSTTGPLTDTQLRAAAVPVSGTFFQATQPVSGTVTATGPLTDTQLRASAVPVSGTVTASGPLTDTQLRASAVPVTAAQATPANLQTTVTPIAITKGTQGTTGFTTQDLKDAGRTSVLLSAAGIASVTSETAISLQQLKGTTGTAGVTSYTVTAGKTLRIQAIQFGVRFTTMSTTVTFGSVTFRIRLTNITGTVALQDSKAVASNVPTPNSDLNIPDGWELPAGTVILFSQQASATTLSVDVLLVGYEY